MERKTNEGKRRGENRREETKRRGGEEGGNGGERKGCVMAVRGDGRPCSAPVLRKT